MLLLQTLFDEGKVTSQLCYFSKNAKQEAIKSQKQPGLDERGV